jgi:hypothetical protein
MAIGKAIKIKIEQCILNDCGNVYLYVRNKIK